jgi:hypothetical protein
VCDRHSPWCHTCLPACSHTDTLKGFGNSILGRFGLSLDNFKADKDPATGAYSVQFVQGGTQPQTPEDAGANEEQ